MYNQKTFLIGTMALLFVIGFPERYLAEEIDLKTGYEMREEENGGTIEDDDSWTTHEEELDFLAELESGHDHVQLEQIGEAGNGMPLHLVTIGYSIPESEREIAEMNYVFMQGGFHGNEPAGRESILKTMRDLASSEDKEVQKMLTESTFIFIPTVNPYGRENNVRRNIDDVDLNRDQIQLNSPEARTIAEIQKKYQPVFFIDAHERVSGPNMSVLGSLNLNVDDEMVALNDKLLDDYLFPNFDREDITSDYYPGSSSPRNIRNLSSLKHSIVLLQESSRADIPTTRVKSHMVGLNAVYEYYRDNQEDIISTIVGSKERNTTIGESRSEPFYLDGEILQGETGVELPEDDLILDPPPYGYLISEYQYDKIKIHLDLFSIDAKKKENGYYISMTQPMRSLIPFLFDKKAEQRLFSGEPIYDFEEIDNIEFPDHPVRIKEYTAFEDSEVGEFPQEWKAIWEGSNWEVQDNPNRLSQFTGSSNARTILTWQRVGEVDEDVEVAALVHADGDDATFEDGNNSLFQLHLHASGKSDYENTYYIDLNKEDGKNNISINRIFGKTLSNLDREEVDFDVSTNEWYNVVFKRDGNALKGKVWPYGEKEPANWQIETTDKYLDYGDVGVGQAAEEVTNDWAFFSVGTGGETAERAPDDLIDPDSPISNKLKLQMKIESMEAKNLENASLTEDSWADMSTAIKTAKALLQGSPTAGEIDDKIKEIDEAYNKLQTATMEFESYFDEPLDESGWVQSWRDSDWSLKEDPSRLVHNTLETGSGRKLLSNKGTGKIYGDVEVSTVVKATEFNNTLFQLHVHSYGEKEYSYYVDLRKNGTMRVNRNVNGTFKALKSESMPFSVEDNQWYNLVLRVDGNVLKGKSWPYGKEEPTDWQVEVEDDSHKSGYMGLGQVGNTSVNEFLFAGIGTNGEQAPRAAQDIVVDKSPLEDKIAEIEEANLEASDYTEETWDVLQSALENAEEVLNNTGVNQEDVDEALEELTAAYEGLEKAEKTSKEALQEKVEEIKKQDLDESQFEEDSWDALQTALKISEELLTLDDESVEDTVLDKALRNLGIAYDALKEKQ